MKIDKFYLFLIIILIFASVVFWPTPRSPVIFDQSFSPSIIKTTLSDKDQLFNHQKSLPILMYHYIRDPDLQSDGIGKNLSVSPNSFESHLKIIQSKGFKTATLAEFATNKVYEPSVILTFDDGYSDFYTDARPILKKYGARATVFVITDKIDRPGYLTSNQIQQLSSENIEIGSHSVSHPNLTNTSDANIIKQLEESKTELEGITAKEVGSLCYPSGKYDEKVIQAVKIANYRAAVTTDFDIASLEKYTLYSLPRLRMKDTTDLVQIFKDYDL